MSRRYPEKPFINVHVYDGKLFNKYKPSRNYSLEEKKKSFSQLLTIIKNSQARKTIEIIIQDMFKNKNESANFQKENNIDSSDILFDISEYLQSIEKDDNISYNCLINNLEEQLSDTINLGICNSGRVTRLFQIYVAFCNKK